MVVVVVVVIIKEENQILKDWLKDAKYGFGGKKR